ncbi:MAG: DUF2508 family protein [Oscillospiraceae bacterium]|nr:DUF2508 family protein [Oscillospiraceae bacterium]
MEGILKGIRVLAGETAKDEECGELIRELHRVKNRLDTVNRNFDMTADEDLLESYIYELNALLARYRYLLRTAREKRAKSDLRGILR